MTETHSERRSGRALLASELLLGAALVFTPLALGTVHYWSIGIALALVGGALVAMQLARPKWPVWPVRVAALVTCYVGLQAVPLPPGVARALSPHGAEMWEYARVTGWHPLSLDPSATAREFAFLFLCTAAFHVASRLGADATTMRRIGRVVATMAVVQCLIVVFHAVIATQRVYGIFPAVRPEAIMGSLGNRNHLAAYLSAAIPIIAAVGLRSPRWRWGWLACAAGAAVIVVLTTSRSGLVGLFVATLLTWWIARRYDDASAALPPATGVALVILPGLAGLFALFVTGRADRLRAMVSPALLQHEEKVGMWRDVPAMIRDYWATGVGRGSFEEILFSYKKHANFMAFSHVECAPLQALVDLGLIVGVALMAAWLWALWQAAHDDTSLLRKAAVVGLVTLTVHDLADFSVDASGTVALMAATLWGLAWPTERTVSRGWRWPWLGASAIAVALAAAALLHGYRGDLRRDLAQLEGRKGQPLEPFLSEAIARHPAEPWFNFVAGRALLVDRQPGPAMHYFNRAIVLDPTAWRPHVGAGEALLLAGRRSQAMLEFRSAYLLSNFHDGVCSELLAQRGFDMKAAFLRLGGDDLTVLSHLLDTLEALHQTTIAEAVALHVLELEPKSLAAHRMVARAALADRRWADVLTHTDPLPADDADGTLLRVVALDRLDRAPEAELLLELRAPGDLSMKLPMALAAREIEQKRGAHAAELLSRIDQTRVPPEQLSHLHLLMARAAELQGRTRDALAEYNAAARLDPSDAGRLELGAAYERAGMTRPALLVYRNLARTSPAAAARIRVLESGPQDSPTISGSAPAGVAPNPFGGKSPDEEDGESTNKTEDGEEPAEDQ